MRITNPAWFGASVAINARPPRTVRASSSICRDQQRDPVERRQTVADDRCNELRELVGRHPLP
jgi:hypothetical protein